MKYKNYVFDLYGTLIDIKTEENTIGLWKKMSEFYACYGAYYAPLKLQKAFRIMDREEREKIKKKIGTDHPECHIEDVFWRLLLEAKQKDVRIPESKETWCELISNVFRVTSRKYIKLFDETIFLIERIKREDSHVFLLSNAQAIFTRPEIHLMGLDRYFDAMYLSSDEERMKPDPAFLKKLLDENGLNTSETAMVGDTVDQDIKVAQECGVHGILLRHGRTDEEIKAEAVKSGIIENFTIVDSLEDIK